MPLRCPNRPLTSVFRRFQSAVNYALSLHPSITTKSKLVLGEYTNHSQVAYAFGCELWAPWSEELGRKWVMQISLLLVNLCQIPCALAPNFKTILAFRALGGLSSAGGSVTLGMVADMFEPNQQQYAIAFIVFSSVSGSVIAPISGGFIETFLSWPWVFWISLIFGACAQAIHFFVPETRSAVLLDRHASHLRKTGEDPNVYGPGGQKNFWQRISFKECGKLMVCILLRSVVVDATSLHSAILMQSTPWWLSQSLKR